MYSSLFLTGKNNLQSRYGANTRSRQKNENYGFEAIAILQKLSPIRGKVWLLIRNNNENKKIVKRTREFSLDVPGARVV